MGFLLGTRMSKLEYRFPKLPVGIRFYIFLTCWGIHITVSVAANLVTSIDVLGEFILALWVWGVLYPYLKVRWVYRRTLFTRKPTLKEMNQVHGHIRKHV